MKLNNSHYMKTIFITGNGFNYMVNGWIKNLSSEQFDSLHLPNKQEIINDIDKITSLWKKFTIVFEEIKQKNPQLSDEELIRLIYSVIDLFSNLPGLSKIMNDKQIDDLKNLFSSFLLDKIREIAQEFRFHHESVGYKNLKKIFPQFGSNFNKILETKLKNSDGDGYFNIFTTNYDGILDTLLTGDPRGFIFKDGFGSHDGELLILKDENVNYNKLLCHLHGSYLYKRSSGYTYKMTGNKPNIDPIMVFNNPDSKEEIVRKDNVLSRYYNIFSDSLKTANNLIILGNSMKNEPHLLKLLKEWGNRSDLKVYVCSTNPKNISDKLKDSYTNDIIEVNTTKFINQEKFLEFLEEII